MEYVGLAIGIIGLLIGVVTVVYTRRQIQQKELAYEIMLNVPLVETSSEFADRLKILFDDVPVKKVTFCLIRLWNSGNQPIRKEDYEQPITIIFAESRILSAEISYTYPLSLVPTLEVLGSGMKVYPLLLNVRDVIVLKLIISNYSGVSHVDGRIAGVKIIVNKPYDTHRVMWRRFGRLVWFFGAMTFILNPISLILAKQLPVLSFVFLGVALIFFLGLCVWGGWSLWDNWARFLGKKQEAT